MKYFLTTPTIDAQIVEIKAKIRLSMNGIVSEQMTKSGIVYKKNYGVSIPRIREIAASYEKNHSLAQQLWALKIRETMILGTLLEQPEVFTIQKANEWVAQFNQIEIVEQACMHLFSKLDFAGSLCCLWVQSNHYWTQVTGFILSARAIEKINAEESDIIIKKGIELSCTNDLHLYKAIGLCLSRLCRKNKETANLIIKEIGLFNDTNSAAQRYISTEVKQEIIFLDIL